jgi:hypothetical protein
MQVVLQLCSMMAYKRNQLCTRLVRPVSLQLKASGLTARAFDGLHKLGVALCHSTVCGDFSTLASGALRQLRGLIQDQKRTFFLVHDNMQLTLRAQSQRRDNQDQFLNLTAATAFVLPSHHSLPLDMGERVKESRRTHSQTPFDLKGLLISNAATERSARLQKRYTYLVIKVLLDTPEFRHYHGRNSAPLQAPPPVEQLSSLPQDQPRMFALRTEDIDESSYEGTIKLVKEMLGQLGFTKREDFQKVADMFVPWCGDQLTVDHLRKVYEYRYQDSNSWARWDWLQTCFGWFHFVMAVANSIYEQHFGNGIAVGLRHSFNLLNRKHLNTTRTKGPFWHHLNEGLHHTGEGHILACWLLEAGVEGVEELLDRTPEELVSLAETILDCHASTRALTSYKLSHNTNPKDCDEQFIASVMFIRDVLTYMELRDSIQCGDVGRLDDLLPTLLCRFAGGSESKYTIELFELFQMYQELPDDARHFIRHNCWLVNHSGRPRGFVPIDQKQEHIIRDIKVSKHAVCKYGKFNSPSTAFVRTLGDLKVRELKSAISNRSVLQFRNSVEFVVRWRRSWRHLREVTSTQFRVKMQTLGY